MSSSRFEGMLERGPGGGALIRLPAHAVEELGLQRRRVRGTVNGTQFVSSTMSAGGGGVCLGVHKATRQAAGIDFGARVVVEMEVDNSPRHIEIPSELDLALRADPQLRAYFDRLAFSHRKEYVEWITSAKRAETRARRVDQSIARLRSDSLERG